MRRNKQRRMELNECLIEQAPSWYNELDFTGLMLLGLFELHKDQIEKILEEEE